MYLCDCGKYFEKPQQLSSHKQSCVIYLRAHNKQYEFVCQICGKTCKTEQGLRRHLRTHTSDRLHYTLATYTCPICGRELAINAKQRHLDTHMGKVRATWNKGLTKDSDSRLKHLGEIISKKYHTGELVSAQKGKPVPEARKDKISRTMRANPAAGGLRQGSGRGKKGWYKGYYCDSTYELAFVIYNLDHNIAFQRCPRSIYYTYTDNGKVHKYFPDFLLPDNSLVEIKGYHSATVDLKTASVTDRAIKVLYEKDLKYAFDYIKERYKTCHIEELYDQLSVEG